MKLNTREAMFQLKQAVYDGCRTLPNVTERFRKRNDHRMIQYLRDRPLTVMIMMEKIIGDSNVSILNNDVETSEKN